MTVWLLIWWTKTALHFRQSGIYCVLLLCSASCPPQQEQVFPAAAVPGLGTTDVKLHCCWCCSPVVLLLWFGHTHAHKNCASVTSGWRVYIPRRGTHQAGYAASRPWHLPSHSDRAQTLKNTTSYIPRCVNRLGYFISIPIYTFNGYANLSIDTFCLDQQVQRSWDNGLLFLRYVCESVYRYLFLRPIGSDKLAQ